MRKQANGTIEPEVDTGAVPAVAKAVPRVATVRGCGNCEHFHRQDGAMGYCHRYPPTPVLVEVRHDQRPLQAITNGAWAPVMPTDICGEWAQKVQAGEFAALARTEGEA